MSDAPSRKRGRPKGTGKIDPGTIVEAALDALANGGYPALKMRGVARTLGVSLATLQHHFATKDVLWRAAIDHLADDTIERRSHVDPDDLAAKIASFLDPKFGRPGLMPALLSDRADGSPERIDYIAERFTAALIQPTERLRSLEAGEVTRPINGRALFALVTIGIGSIAGAPDAISTIYGFDLATPGGRTELAEGLADIIGLGILYR